MGHPNLMPEINDAIAKSEIEGGAWMKDLPEGRSLIVTTKSRDYTIRKERGRTTIQGHPKYCPIATDCAILGSSFGGSMLKMGFVGRGMFLEFSTRDHGTVTTSEIQEVREVA